MRDGFKVIDADRHVLEPTDLFAKYLPEKFRGRVEIKGPNQSYRLVDGEKIEIGRASCRERVLRLV